METVKPESNEHSTSIGQSSIKGGPLNRVEELVFLVDWIVKEIRDLSSIWLDFSERRRLMKFLFTCYERAKVSLFDIPLTDETIARRVRTFLSEIVQSCLQEADYFYPHPWERKFVRDNTELKRKVERMETEWTMIKRSIFTHEPYRRQFERLKIDELKQWQILGFANQEEFKNKVLIPSFEIYCQNASLMVKELLRTILDRKIIRIDQLEEDGFPFQVLSETINCLYTNNLVKATDDPNVLNLTRIGAAMILKCCRSENKP